MQSEYFGLYNPTLFDMFLKACRISDDAGFKPSDI
jgi:hypothetical protein